MSSFKFNIRYKYYKVGSNSKVNTSFSGTVASQSETMVMQKLKEKHKGYEIELEKLDWK